MDKQFKFRCSDGFLDLIESAAEHHDRSKSEIMRWILRGHLDALRISLIKSLEREVGEKREEEIQVKVISLFDKYQDHLGLEEVINKVR